MYTVQHQRVVPCHWKCCRSIDHVRPTKSCVLVRHCKYSSILYRFQLFDVEKYRDLKILVRGHSRSFKLVPFESLGKVSYSPSIVTMALSCIISEIKRDIARKSWCFHTRLHSTPPSVSEYFHPVWYRTFRMVGISADVKTEDMCNRLVPWLSGRTLAQAPTYSAVPERATFTYRENPRWRWWPPYLMSGNVITSGFYDVTPHLVEGYLMVTAV